MKDRGRVIKLLELLTLIVIYHVTKSNNLFLYALTISGEPM